MRRMWPANTQLGPTPERKYKGLSKLLFDLDSFIVKSDFMSHADRLIPPA